MSATQPQRETRHRRGPSPPRWALKRLNQDALMAAVLVTAWREQQAGQYDSAEGAVRFGDEMTHICDFSMPRARNPPQRRATYWWSREIEEVRRHCILARRQYTRARRRRNGDAARTAEPYRAYSEAHRTLQLAIRRAKAQSWQELLGTLERDPWGRPYRMVLNQLRPWVLPVTSTLEPQVREGVMDALFPRRREGVVPPQPPAEPIEWSAEMGVSAEEMAAAVKRLRAKNKAPGPDGVPGRVLALALSVLGPRLGQLFDSCLRSGTFLPLWKEAKLVLLRTPGRPAESPSAYRPICLLDEAGKLLKRVIAARLSKHMSEVGPDLADSQLGFRGGRSTVDAIRRVRSLSEEVTSRGGVVLAVSLDIVNAFNTLP
ncbi:uncharacterized protein LOC105276783 [Ooceraea biroi]|uniref:uncharacterized protein LOC105276783 n=1 Tax=Ooceraea biroi TaxID=2015173 RepID=UPI000F0949A1|nr:uncharacterized protein LOC105276783 [Ooceraea biroi]